MNGPIVRMIMIAGARPPIHAPPRGARRDVAEGVAGRRGGSWAKSTHDAGGDGVDGAAGSERMPMLDALLGGSQGGAGCRRADAPAQQPCRVGLPRR